MKILAVSGSLRAVSSNSVLLRAITSLSPPGMSFEIYTELADLPHFNPDLDVDVPPDAVGRWRNLLSSAEAVLICTPEYAFGVPGSLKNALDWVVSSGEFVGKPTAVISASPLETGGEKALASLVQTLKVMTADIADAGTLAIPFIRSKFDAKGALIDRSTVDALERVLDTIKEERNKSQ
jgi:chromate reductase